MLGDVLKGEPGTEQLIAPNLPGPVRATKQLRDTTKLRPPPVDSAGDLANDVTAADPALMVQVSGQNRAADLIVER